MKGYKGFDKDLKCRGFQYEVGKTYECEGKITLCENGFHFCEDPKRICDYYGDLTTCRYCEIEASGEIVKGEGKCVCSKITIVREIPLQELLALVNEGSRNTGWMNEGDYNEGDCNKGDYNEGDCNEGNCNKGDCNEGDCNEGDRNKGDYNIGSYNRADGACGIFNTDGGCVIFNRYTPMKHIEIEKTDGYRYLALCVAMRREPTEDELAEIRKLPNFDEKVMNELIFGKGDKK
jgi:hypothetical protein